MLVPLPLKPHHAHAETVAYYHAAVRYIAALRKEIARLRKESK